MNLTILKVSDILSDITIDKNSIIKIIENNKVELLGQFTNDNNKIDPNKISHSISNLRYNNVLNSLDCKITPLDTAYGKQLSLFFDKEIKLRWYPIFVNNDNKIKLVTINVSKND